MSVSERTEAPVLSDTLICSGHSHKASSAKTFREVVTYIEVLADYVTSVAAICVAYYLYHMLHVGKQIHYPLRDVAATALILGALIPFLLERDGAYKGGNSLLRIRETERVLRVPWQTLMFLLPVTYFMGKTFSRGTLLLVLAIAPLLLTLQKHIVFSLIRYSHVKGYGVRRVVIYGAGDTGRRVLSALLHSPRVGLLPVAVIDDDPGLDRSRLFELSYSRRRFVEIHCGPVTQQLLKDCQCEMLIIAIPGLSRDKFPQALQAAREAGADVAFLPNRAISENQWIESIDIDGLLLTSVGNPVTVWRYEITKRLFDIISSLFLLILLSPVICVIALLIRLDSPGPVLFRQMRVGKKGKLFSMYKFRSMRIDAPKYGVSPVDSKDSRITRVGRLLRKTSVDELPQLLNVLKGSMSLVGPRPEMPFIVDTYAPKQRQRLQVVPGITGLWQLSADRAFHIHESIEYDLYYVRNRTFFLDLAVLVHTAFFAMRGV